VNTEKEHFRPQKALKKRTSLACPREQTMYIWTLLSNGEGYNQCHIRPCSYVEEFGIYSVQWKTFGGF
jgi:hypothetical protein